MTIAPTCGLERHLNSCSKLKLTFLLASLASVLLADTRAEALNVHGVYRTACTRELGVILQVQKRNLSLLKFDGTIIKIPRHEIVSLAYYPVTQLPLTALPSRPEVPALRIKTIYRDEIVDLATGWPVDYSETKIAFLLDSGKDIVIDKDSIWSLEFVYQLDTTKRAAAGLLEFAHPQTAGFCASQSKLLGSARTVFAQQILNDRVVIKRELDRLKEGYEEIVEFDQDQKFYPVPHVYKDRTALGLWVSMFSRYGASKTRSNNFTPMLVDELHLGPFRYQHIFLSGSAPNNFLLHNEAQSQIYYRFKAAYFHASVFVDPNLVLVGTKYQWRPDDLVDEVIDDRLNEIGGVEFGFDLGPVAIELAPAVIAQAAVKSPEFFESKSDLNLWRVGARFTKRHWQAQVFAGYATGSGDAQDLEDEFFAGNSDWQYLYGRANLSFDPHPRVTAIASTIYRKLNYELSNRTDFNGNTLADLSYRSTAVSAALQGWYALSHRFNVGANAVLELHTNKGAGESRRRRLFPKLGISTSFSF